MANACTPCIQPGTAPFTGAVTPPSIADQVLALRFHHAVLLVVAVSAGLKVAFPLVNVPPMKTLFWLAATA